MRVAISLDKRIDPAAAQALARLLFDLQPPDTEAPPIGAEVPSEPKASHARRVG